MAFKPIWIEDIQSSCLAGLVLAVRCAQQAGGNVHFIAGALAMAEHDALTFALDWPAIVDQARELLGRDGAELLSGALALGEGGGNA